MNEAEEIIKWLSAHRSARNVDGMARFGIRTDTAYGVSMPTLRQKAKAYKGRHEAAMALWDTGIHEARIMASLIADPGQTDPAMMDKWVADFDSWDLCDQCCLNLFRKLSFVEDKIETYARDEREFVRRTAFVLIAVLAVHGREIPNERFAEWMELAERSSTDGRNFVRKSVSWALRQTGKRNFFLNECAVSSARRLAESSDPSAGWVGRDALRELTSQRTLDFIRDHRR